MAFGPWEDPSSATGDFTNPTFVFASDRDRATATATGKTVTAYDFGFTFAAPGNNSRLIDDIQVQMQGEVVDLIGGAGTMTLEVDLSWDGGTSWTSVTKDASWTQAEGEVYKLASTAEFPVNGWTWGRIWSQAELANANFRVRVTLTALTGLATTAYINHVQCRIDTHLHGYAGGGGDILKTTRRVFVG